MQMNLKNVKMLTLILFSTSSYPVQKHYCPIFRMKILNVYKEMKFPITYS